jgi:hypothetical protein
MDCRFQGIPLLCDAAIVAEGRVYLKQFVCAEPMFECSISSRPKSNHKVEDALIT